MCRSMLQEEYWGKLECIVNRRSTFMDALTSTRQLERQPLTSDRLTAGRRIACPGHGFA